jgi:poly(3-hydroxybutyrate) depolymerase
MRPTRLPILTPLLFLAFSSLAAAAGRMFEVSYPASTEPCELQMGVVYRLWIPDGVRELRAVIVHQHGCGVGSAKGAATAAADLHWQALAKKWDAALMGPAYQQEEKQNCRLWCDPRNGSHHTFLRALDDLAAKSQHAELKRVPWCLWGHSGGGFWSSLMQTMYPQRIVAIWLRSGTALAAWEKGDIAKASLTPPVYEIPVMCNPGVKENGNKRFQGAWDGTLAMFKSYRDHGAPIGFAPDPRTAHECGDARYLAIPFFDACLAMRLPDRGSKDQKLKPVDKKQAWLAEPLADKPAPAASYSGEPLEAVWLPNQAVAKAWAEYVKTGAVGDTTPPPAPTNVKLATTPDGTTITWSAEADLESGIQAFLIRRDGQPLAQVPEKPVGRFGRALFQGMSYGDTPDPKLPEMQFVDSTAKTGLKHRYEVIAVNSVGLKSASAAAR